MEYVQSLLKDLKKVLPDTEIWLDGPEVSYDCEEVLEREPNVRGIMTGEGETTFELQSRYHGEARLDIRGLVYRDEEESSGHTGIREYENQMIFPFVYEDKDKISEPDHLL